MARAAGPKPYPETDPMVCEMHGREGLVTITTGRTKISMSPEQARAVAAELVRYAEAIEKKWRSTHRPLA